MSDVAGNIEKCHGCAIPAKTVPNCPASGVPFIEHAEHGYCPRVAGPLFGDGKVPASWESRGVGDVIGKLTAALGITPCGGCKKRQAALNHLLPFREGR